jgi:hypothetical protein
MTKTMLCAACLVLAISAVSAQAQDTSVSFVTSQGPGVGANLGGCRAFWF